MTQRWTQVGPLCPQEVLKRLGSTSELVAQRRERVSPIARGPEEAWKSLRTCSPKERERVSPIARGPDSHKELPSCQVAVWLEPTPRVWKGAVLVIASASQSKQKYEKDSKVARII